MRQKELLVIAIVVFLTIIAWVVFEVNQVKTKVELEETFEEPPESRQTINAEVFSILQNKTP